ncbi:Uncharacterized protein HZ326_16893 [Fusarium oxysporum f. sp. albedinis]|nr:Uncharacterized protein HZ326_16893 [Fusarium oxysporum f. sp. albedinis]
MGYKTVLWVVDYRSDIWMGYQFRHNSFLFLSFVLTFQLLTIQSPHNPANYLPSHHWSERNEPRFSLWSAMRWDLHSQSRAQKNRGSVSGEVKKTWDCYAKLQKYLGT